MWKIKPKKSKLLPLTEEQLKELESKREELETQIQQLENEGHKVEEYDEFINLLHEYNTVKDIAQNLMGRLAGFRGTTARRIAESYDAPTE